MSKMLRLGTLVLALSLVLAACGGGFSDEIRDEFMASCVPAEGTEFCECTLDGLEKAFTTDEFLRLGQNAFDHDSEPPPPELFVIIETCNEADIGG